MNKTTDSTILYSYMNIMKIDDAHNIISLTHRLAGMKVVLRRVAAGRRPRSHALVHDADVDGAIRAADRRE